MESLTNNLTVSLPESIKEELPPSISTPLKQGVVDESHLSLNNEQNDKSIGHSKHKSAFGSYMKEQDDKEVSPCKSEEEKISKRRKMKKPRKIRTLITKEKLLRMNKIFGQFTNNQQANKKNMSLKEIASILELGYSTILHKYRQYRAHKKVKAGALIASMQKKRKYKKSLEVEKLIQKAMTQMEFYTATEVTDFIQQHYGKKFSRSIISRHLGQMGFSYKNVTGGLHANNGNKLEKIKKIYAEIMWPLIESRQTLIYFDELSCCVRDSNPDNPVVITVVIAASVHGVLYFHLQNGFITREKFFDIIKQFLVTLKASSLCKLIQGDNEQLYVVADLDSIHRDSCEQATISGLAPMLIQENAQILYIPPHSPQFNPLEQIFAKIKDMLREKINSGEVHDYDTFWEELDGIMQATRQDNIEDAFNSVNSEIATYLPKRVKIDH